MTMMNASVNRPRGALASHPSQRHNRLTYIYEWLSEKKTNEK